MRIMEWQKLGDDIDNINDIDNSIVQSRGPNSNNGIGQSISISKNGQIVAIGITSKNIVKVYRLDISTWVKMGSDISNTFNHGNSVSLSNDGQMITIGDHENNIVRVYQWNETNGDWEQRGNDITSTSTSTSTDVINFGWSVSLSGDGNTIAIGGTGRVNVEVYQWDGSDWNNLGQNIVGNEIGEYDGLSVSISDDGQQVAIGAPNKNSIGQVKVYRLNNSDSSNIHWEQSGTNINGEEYSKMFGYMVSLSDNGNILAVGDPSYGVMSGRVKIYMRDRSQWKQLGNNIYGETTYDHMGISVSLSGDGDTVAIGTLTKNSIGTNIGHVRVYRIYEQSWILIDTIVGNGDGFGGSVSLSGEGHTVAFKTSTGYVEVYQSNQLNSKWRQLGQDGKAIQGLSGYSISLSGDGHRVAIGEPYKFVDQNDIGNVRVYQWNHIIDYWEQMGDDINGEATNDYSGHSVSLSSDGQIIAIGAPRNNNGLVRVLYWDNLSYKWEQMGNNIEGIEAVQSGYSVSLSNDGKTIAIGCNHNDNYRGCVRVYRWNQNSNEWDILGNYISGKIQGDQSGHSVSISSDGLKVAIGAPYDGNNGGYVRVFQWNNDNWENMGSDINGQAAGDNSGYSVSLSYDGQRIAIGAPFNNDNGNCSGNVRVYQWNASNEWEILGSNISGEIQGDQSGYSVSLSNDGQRVAIGAKYNDQNGLKSGHVRVYNWDYSDQEWKLMGSDIDGKMIYDHTGHSVSLSNDGKRVAIGAHYTNTNTYESIGSVRVYEFEEYSGKWLFVDTNFKTKYKPVFGTNENVYLYDWEKQTYKQTLYKEIMFKQHLSFFAKFD